MAAKSAIDRKAQLLDVGAKLAGKYGAANITRRMVAEHGKVSEALITNYFGSRADAQKTFAKHAKKLGIEQPTKEKIASIGTKLRSHAGKVKPAPTKNKKLPGPSENKSAARAPMPAPIPLPLPLPLP